MEDTLITFKTAKLAKEKGFKELCFAAFHKNNRNDGYFESGIISQSEYFKFPTMSNGDKIAVLQKDYIHTILRPTQSLLQKWLREVHKIDVEAPLVYKLNTREYLVRIYKNNTEIILPTFHYYKSYEEALETALYQALNLIK